MLEKTKVEQSKEDWRTRGGWMLMTILARMVGVNLIEKIHLAKT